jgi:phosphate transport system substrate-binding protein
VGSSTVFPFSSRVAETYSQKMEAAAPRVEALGTGGGIKLFCSGVGPNTPDVANASRPMTASEFDQCAKNGVRHIVELKIGYDGVVLSNARNAPAYDFKPEDIYLGLAAQAPGPNGGFIANPHRTWREVNPALPAERIQVYGPPPTSGTRDAFAELAMEGGAKKVPAMAALREADKDAFKERAARIREDGAWIDAGENDNAVVQILTRTPGSIGVVGYSFLNQNRSMVKAASIGGVPPSREAIQSGDYPLSRSLYVYVKGEHAQTTPGLREFLLEHVSDAAIGVGGYLLDRGLIALPPAEVVETRRRATALTPMTRPEK